jgi:hypothetical protein
MQVVCRMNPRGGISLTVTAAHGSRPSALSSATTNPPMPPE